MKPSNFLVIMSDEHNPKVMGSSGHPMIKTPHLDSLAANGVRFNAAYTNSPICVPARASFATGNYVNKIRYWDNAMPYEGRIPSWGHRLSERGHRVVSIGKLHYRNKNDPCGFDEEIVPLHVVDGLGDLMGMVRDDPPVRQKAREYIENAGRGESTYTEYDREITQETKRWLREEAPKHTDKPWTLFVSLVCPHFPLMAPNDFYDLYDPQQVPWPVQNVPNGKPEHPGIEDYWRLNQYSQPFSEEETRRAITAYFGMVSFLDDNIGQVLGTLNECGLADNTRILYTSDHGDNLGRNGLYGKSTMYEDSAGIPMILAGAEVPKGKVNTTPVSLVDAFPSIMACAGEEGAPEDSGLPGASLFDIANGANPSRTVLSEYHATCSTTGIFMIRKEQYKYVHYVKYRPQLFDLAKDPEETTNLAPDPAYREVVEGCEAALKTVVDPGAVDQLAKNDQWQRISDFGGRDSISTRGTFGYTPAPGETIVYG